MKFVRPIFILTIVTLSFGCKSKPDVNIVLEEYKMPQLFNDIYHNKSETIYYNKEAKVFLEFFNTGELKKISSSILDHKFGHSFVFDKEGKLKNYYFLMDSLTAKIIIERGNGKFKEKGKIFIDFIPNETNGGIKKYSLLFSKFPRENILVNISYDGINYKPVSLKVSTLMPMLLETDVYPKSEKIFLEIKANSLLMKLDDLALTKYESDTLILK